MGDPGGAGAEWDNDPAKRVGEDPERRLDRIISDLMSHPRGCDVTPADCHWLIARSLPVLLGEPSLLELRAPINICGDIHGQYYDLVRLFRQAEPVPATRWLFLGDYVDRGESGVEVLCLLLALKLRHPTCVYLLRGNHETGEMSQLYGFMEECHTKLGTAMYAEFCDLFAVMPLAATVSRKIFCVHGGLSPGLETLSQIACVERPVGVPESGLIADLLWSDPDAATPSWRESDRGSTWLWGLGPARKFMAKNGIAVLVRAHQMAMGGVEFPFKPDKAVITVFSAPGYAGEFRNNGAFLRVDANLVVTSGVVKYEPKRAVGPPQNRRMVCTPIYRGPVVLSGGRRHSDAGGYGT